MKRLKVSIVTEPGGFPQHILDTPERVQAIVHDLADLDRENFEVLHLDIRHRLIARETVTVGSLDRATATPRDVFAGAFTNGTKNLILVHNHPSGDASPSAQDKVLTERLRKAAALLGLSILDHVIVSTQGFYSFAQHEMWQDGKE